MNEPIRIILTRENIKQLNEKKRLTFNIKSQIIQIETNHFIEVSPLNIIGENRDDLLTELRFLREYVKILENKKPTIEEFDDMIRICWSPGMIDKVIKKNNVELYYSKNGRFLGAGVLKKR